MKRLFAVAVAAALGGFTALPAAQAAPLARGANIATDSPLIEVAQGCGRGWTRTPRGRCVPMRGYGPRYGYGPRPYVVPRAYGYYGGPRYGVPRGYYRRW